MEIGLAVDDLGGDSVVGLGAGDGNIPLAQVIEDFFDRTVEWIAQAATAGTLDADDIVVSEPVIAETRWETLCCV